VAYVGVAAYRYWKQGVNR